MKTQYSVAVDFSTRKATVEIEGDCNEQVHAIGDMLLAALSQALPNSRQWIKILREHAPICLDCWNADDTLRLAQPDAAAADRIAEGVADGLTPAITGERFWCEVLCNLPGGGRLVRVDNETKGPGVPRLNEIITLPAGEDVLDTEWLPGTEHFTGAMIAREGGKQN